jgi:hypothetical protein
MRFLVVCLLIAVVAMVGCRGPMTNNLPPSTMLMHPGPGVDGPGPGVMTPVLPPMPPWALPLSQVAFVGPEGMSIQWDVSAPGMFDSQPLVAPGRYNFPQGAIYRLKLSSVPGRPGVELYPTLEIGASLPRTEAFLAHNAIPVQLTEEDFDQVLSGNFVTKVIYLPDPEFQELALAGVETLVSTRLDPGVDPIVEADRRGAILGIVRLGNKDLETPTAGQMGGAMAGGAAMGGVMPVSYNAPCVGTAPPGFVAGVTAPTYGMPMCGTPIGLAGPPHVPLGVPAGLKNHSITNHTCTCFPDPVRNFRMDVMQVPGQCYPAPVAHVKVCEHNQAGCETFHGCFQREYGSAAGVPAGQPCTEACPTACPQ